MAKIKLQIDPTDKILLKRNLNKNGNSRTDCMECGYECKSHRIGDYSGWGIGGWIDSI